MNNTIELLKILESLYKFLELEDTSEITYVMSDLPQVINRLNDSVSLNEGNTNRILDEVRIHCKSYFPSHGGLSDYFIWRENFAERKRLNEILENYKKRMWNLIEEE